MDSSIPAEENKTCPICHGQLPLREGRGRPRKYCSPVCKAKADIGQKRARPRPEPKRTKTCQYCGEVFGARPQEQKYCSRSCALAARRPSERPCAVCGVRFRPRDQANIYCSPGCLIVARQRRQFHTCRYCGEAFLPKVKDRVTYCSRECAFAHARQFKEARLGAEAAMREGRRQHVCRVCGKEFEGRPNAVCCSCGCAAEKARRKYRESFVSVRKTNPFVTKACLACGKEFATNFMAATRIYCSARCAETATKQITRRKRRAILKGAEAENIIPDVVYRRDGWRCGLCGGKVDKQLKYPHPLSKSLDHITPLAKGGAHVYRNVQLAHLACNRHKREVGGGQLRLMD